GAQRPEVAGAAQMPEIAPEGFVHRVVMRRAPQEKKTTIIARPDGERTSGTVPGRKRRLGRERREGVTGHASDAPVGKHGRAQRSVKPDRLLVPVEHRPLEPPAPAFHGEAGKVTQQGAAVAAASEFGPDE